MPISYIWKFIGEAICTFKKNLQQPRIVIPYGRYSYGPQPEIVGSMPWVARKVRGSRVGSFCSMASGLRFTFLGRHDYNMVSGYPFVAFYEKWKINNMTYKKGEIDAEIVQPTPIIIENDVWIATNVTIKEGVKIANGAVIAMESLVTKDVPPYALVGGRPARVIKYRFNSNQIESLQRIAWWNWSDENIKKMLPYLCSHDVNEFIKAAENIHP